MDFIANATGSIFAQGWTPELQKMVGGQQTADGLLKAVQAEYEKELASDRRRRSERRLTWRTSDACTGGTSRRAGRPTDPAFARGPSRARWVGLAVRAARARRCTGCSCSSAARS